MSSLLHIMASPRGESYSTQLAREFINAYRQIRPQDQIETLDLYKADIPQFYAPAAKAKYSVSAGQTPRDEAEAAWKPVVDAVNYFKRFDKYVVSSPMWNFSIPYRLKQYIDVIVQPSLTVSFSPAKGYTGLVTGRPLALLLARGGIYQPGNPLETYDFQDTYLRTIFGFIGFTDIRTVSIQGTQQSPAEKFQADLRTAIAQCQEAAREMAGEAVLV